MPEPITSVPSQETPEELATHSCVATTTEHRGSNPIVLGRYACARPADQGHHRRPSRCISSAPRRGAAGRGGVERSTARRRLINQDFEDEQFTKKTAREGAPLYLGGDAIFRSVDPREIPKG